jgi:hypothetical protein
VVPKRSGKCQFSTHAPPQVGSAQASLDNLVGTREQRWQDGDASAFAILRLWLSRNFVGCSTARCLAVPRSPGDSAPGLSPEAFN